MTANLFATKHTQIIPYHLIDNTILLSYQASRHPLDSHSVYAKLLEETYPFSATFVGEDKMRYIAYRERQPLDGDFDEFQAKIMIPFAYDEELSFGNVTWPLSESSCLLSRCRLIHKSQSRRHLLLSYRFVRLL